MSSGGEPSRPGYMEELSMESDILNSCPLSQNDEGVNLLNFKSTEQTTHSKGITSGNKSEIDALDGLGQKTILIESFSMNFKETFMPELPPIKVKSDKSSKIDKEPAIQNSKSFITPNESHSITKFNPSSQGNDSNEGLIKTGIDENKSCVLEGKHKVHTNVNYPELDHNDSSYDCMKSNVIGHNQSLGYQNRSGEGIAIGYVHDRKSDHASLLGAGAKQNGSSFHINPGFISDNLFDTKDQPNHESPLHFLNKRALDAGYESYNKYNSYTFKDSDAYIDDMEQIINRDPSFDRNHKNFQRSTESDNVLYQIHHSAKSSDSDPKKKCNDKNRNPKAIGSSSKRSSFSSIFSSNNIKLTGISDRHDLHSNSLLHSHSNKDKMVNRASDFHDMSKNETRRKVLRNESSHPTNSMINNRSVYEKGGSGGSDSNGPSRYPHPNGMKPKSKPVANSLKPEFSPTMRKTSIFGASGKYNGNCTAEERMDEDVPDRSILKPLGDRDEILSRYDHGFDKEEKLRNSNRFSSSSRALSTVDSFNIGNFPNKSFRNGSNGLSSHSFAEDTSSLANDPFSSIDKYFNDGLFSKDDAFHMDDSTFKFDRYKDAEGFSQGSQLFPDNTSRGTANSSELRADAKPRFGPNNFNTDQFSKMVSHESMTTKLINGGSLLSSHKFELSDQPEADETIVYQPGCRSNGLSSNIQSNAYINNNRTGIQRDGSRENHSFDSDALRSQSGMDIDVGDAIAGTNSHNAINLSQENENKSKNLYGGGRHGRADSSEKSEIKELVIISDDEETINKQLEEDEKLARQLQEEFAAEFRATNDNRTNEDEGKIKLDEEIAQFLQEQESGSNMFGRRPTTTVATRRTRLSPQELYPELFADTTTRPARHRNFNESQNTTTRPNLRLNIPDDFISRFRTDHNRSDRQYNYSLDSESDNSDEGENALNIELAFANLTRSMDPGSMDAGSTHHARDPLERPRTTSILSNLSSARTRGRERARLPTTVWTAESAEADIRSRVADSLIRTLDQIDSTNPNPNAAATTIATTNAIDNHNDGLPGDSAVSRLRGREHGRRLGGREGLRGLHPRVGDNSRTVESTRAQRLRRFERPNASAISASFDELYSDSLSRHMRFPSSMDLDQRLVFLGRLEEAVNQHFPLALRLATVERDFDENDYEMLLALDESVSTRPRGATQTKINQLPTSIVSVDEASDEGCCICLEDHAQGETIRRLPCLHYFHVICIDTWLKTQAVCPICKRGI